MWSGISKWKQQVRGRDHPWSRCSSIPRPKARRDGAPDPSHAQLPPAPKSPPSLDLNLSRVHLPWSLPVPANFSLIATHPLPITLTYYQLWP